MIRTADIFDVIDMSRVERNQDKYIENETDNGRSGLMIGRILSAAGTVIMALVVAACLGLVIPKVAGYEGYVVVSGSMEPAIPVGSIVFSKETDPSTLQTGDVIVFVDESRCTTPITHRVVSNDTAAGTIVTKGDANEREDLNPVTYSNVIGKVAVHIPKAGAYAALITTALGKVILLLLLLEGWLFKEIGRRLKIRANTRM